MVKQHLSVTCLLALWLVFPALVPAQTSREPENYTDFKERLLNYHDSGEYEQDIEAVVERATRYLLACKISPSDKPAAVFDIDDTALSNWHRLVQHQFYSDETIRHEEAMAANAPAIEPVLGLFRLAMQRKVSVLFITGRKASERTATEKNLQAAGYSGYAVLIMKTQNDERPASKYKLEARRKLAEEDGYRILLNIGDQRSDLDGGFAERAFKIPNPFYKLP